MLGGASDAAAELRPRLESSNTIVNLGDIPQFGRKRVVLILRNAGDGPLIIESLRACCGLGSALLSGPEVAPGTCADVLLTMGPIASRGRVRKKLPVISSDPAARIMEIVVMANIVGVLDIKPSKLQLGTVHTGTGASFDLRITPVRQESIRQLEFEYNKNYFDVSWTLPAADGTSKDAVVRVALRKGAPVGKVMETIRGRALTDTWYSLVVQVDGKVTGDIDVRPARLMFVHPRPGVDVTRRIALIGPPGETLRVLEATVSSETLTVHTEIDGKGRPVLSVTLKAEAAVENLEATIFVTTDHAVEKNLRIPVRVMNRGRETRKMTSRGRRASAAKKKWPVTFESAQYSALFQKDATPDGLQKVTYESGGPLKEFSFRQGVLQGITRTYYETGELLFKQEYRNGRELSLEKYSASGKLIYSRTHKDTKP